MINTIRKPLKAFFSWIFREELNDLHYSITEHRVLSKSSNVESVKRYKWNLDLTKDEQFYVSKRDVDVSDVKNWHFHLQRNLIIEELIILELCSRNGILWRENYFK